MRSINIHEAKTHLSRLVEEAANGDAFVIAKAGRPLVKVVPLQAEDQVKVPRLGFMKGEFNVPDDFDTMMQAEIEQIFYGDDSLSNLLLDTHLLLWAALDDPRLPAEAKSLIEDESNTLAFSAASIWEVAIKHGGGRHRDFPDPVRLRARLLAAGYRDIPITSDHAIEVGRLPPLHRDPFDRLLIVQARAEGVVLLTVDRVLADYPGPVRLVR